MKGRKAQVSFFLKISFLIGASVMFILILMQIIGFRKSVVEEKESSEFRIQVMDILQKLVTDKDCLAYENGKIGKKIVIDKNKLDLLALKFGEVEPNCAKALGFDYNVMVRQFERNLTFYPGKIEKLGKPEYATDFAQHVCEVGDNKVLFVRMNFLPNEEICKGSSELDIPSMTPRCPRRCLPDPLEKCPYPKHGRCGVAYHCPKEHCKCIKNIGGRHPWIVSCNKTALENFTKCKLIWSAHTWCGKVAKNITLPVGNLTTVNISLTTWSFGLPVGVGITSFSPGKALKEEIDISIPVSIKYNETFSAEGILYIHAVRGELESLYSLLEDICRKAEAGIATDFSRIFHFSYPVNYKEPYLCMLDACKRFVCSFKLDFENVSEEGDYLLKFSVDLVEGVIKVGK